MKITAQLLQFSCKREFSESPLLFLCVIMKYWSRCVSEIELGVVHRYSFVYRWGENENSLHIDSTFSPPEFSSSSYTLPTSPCRPCVCVSVSFCMWVCVCVLCIGVCVRVCVSSVFCVEPIFDSKIIRNNPHFMANFKILTNPNPNNFNPNNLNRASPT